MAQDSVSASAADDAVGPSPHTLVRENFCPTILVFATPDADQSLKKNGENFSILSLLGSFSSVTLPSALVFQFHSLRTHLILALEPILNALSYFLLFSSKNWQSRLLGFVVRRFVGWFLGCPRCFIFVSFFLLVSTFPVRLCQYSPALALPEFVFQTRSDFALIQTLPIDPVRMFLLGSNRLASAGRR